jgi:hypothetical protein
MTDFELAITSGGDERIELKEGNLNKYFLNPNDSEGLLSRASCTCSPLSNDVKARVKASFKMMTSGEATVEDIRIKQRYRMKALLQNSSTTDFNIFFAPSGSDLCYYPLLFSKIINGDKPIISLITRPEELGTGSILANTGKYHAEKTQILEKVVKGTSIKKDLEVDHLLFPARTSDGNILDHKRKIYEAIDKYRDTHAIIVNLVIGSKSGIEDSVSIIQDGPDDVTWVIDLCQMRARPKLFNELLAENCLLMITGSKFYQSPPFSGALLVPETYAKNILPENINEYLVQGFDTVYSKYDIPPSYRKLRGLFNAHENIGLTLRWEAAICESENLSKYTERESTFAISNWNRRMIDYLESKACFELLPDQDLTNISILSVKVKGVNGFFNAEELKNLYEHLVLRGHEYQDQFKKLMIGQPVSYEEHAFVRFALGSTNVRELIESGHDMGNDFLLIDVVEKIVAIMDKDR